MEHGDLEFIKDVREYNRILLRWYDTGYRRKDVTTALTSTMYCINKASAHGDRHPHMCLEIGMEKVLKILEEKKQHSEE